MAVIARVQYQKVIPNTAKLKVVTVALINNLLHFLSYVYLQYKSINVYKDKKGHEYTYPRQ